MMKTLYMIGGTMGVGKTTVCQQLKQDLPNSVFLDGDWCWDASPFQVTDETKAMVTNNICYLLNNFLKCSAYENIIFCWVMHEQSIQTYRQICIRVNNCPTVNKEKRLRNQRQDVWHMSKYSKQSIHSHTAITASQVLIKPRLLYGLVALSEITPFLQQAETNKFLGIFQLGLLRYRICYGLSIHLFLR